MSSDEPNGHSPAARISVSLETLRTEIRLANAELELRIIDRVASKQEAEALRVWVNKLQEQVDHLEEDKAGREAVSGTLRYLIGGGVLTTIFMLIQLALTFYVVTQTSVGS